MKNIHGLILHYAFYHVIQESREYMGYEEGL